MKQQTLYQLPTGQYAMLIGKNNWRGMNGYVIVAYSPSSEKCKTMFLDEKAIQPKEAKLSEAKEKKIWKAFEAFLKDKL